MTTTVALAARDFIAVGSDSLATTSLALVNPTDLALYFDNSGNLSVDADGKPLLKTYSQLWTSAQQRPVNQLPSVTKLFSLEPRRAVVLFAGASRIGDTSIKNLVAQFSASPACTEQIPYTIKSLTGQLRDFIVKVYDAEVPQTQLRAMMEVLVAGYSAEHRQPEINRILFQWNWADAKFSADITEEVHRGSYSVAFSGQYDVIQRVVNGIDVNSWLNLKARALEILNAYRDKIQADLAAHGHPMSVLAPDPQDKELDLFSKGFGGVAGMGANVSDLSERAGIEFVEFLIMTMIKAQEFSASIPTVGGEIHLGVLTKNTGFKWLRKPYLERAGDPTHS